MPDRSGQPWSADDDETLLRMFAAGDRRRVIATALGRTGFSVSSRRIILARQGSRPARRRQDTTSNRGAPWSQDDCATFLRMLSAEDSYPTIARALKRTQTEVASKVHTLAQVAEIDAARGENG